MLRLGQTNRVHLCLGFTDMRKSIDGLSLLVVHQLGGQLQSGDFFVFCARNRRLVKILYWDRNGFCLWQKRLVRARFRWPLKQEEVREIDNQTLIWLLEGLDIDQAHERLYRPVSA